MALLNICLAFRKSIKNKQLRCRETLWGEYVCGSKFIMLSVLTYKVQK